MLRSVAIVFMLTVTPPVAPADVAGTWHVVMPAGSAKRPDGGTAEWKAIRGALVIAQKGSELSATWTAIDEWTLAGRVDADGRFTLESAERDIPTTTNGRKGSARARWTLRGALKDGALSGSAALEVDDREPIVHTWTATRP